MKRKEIKFRSIWVRYVGVLAMASSLAFFSCDSSNNTDTRSGYDKDAERIEEGQGAGEESDMNRGVGESSSEDIIMQEEGNLRDTTVEADRGVSNPSQREGVGSGTMGDDYKSGSDEMRGAGTIHRGSGTTTTDINQSTDIESNSEQQGQGTNSQNDMMQGSGTNSKQNKQQDKSQLKGADTDLNTNVGEGKFESDTLGDYLEGPRDPARGAGTGVGTGMGTGAGTWKGTAIDTMATELYNDSI